MGAGEKGKEEDCMIRILIVEDDENISKMLAATLSIGDYEYDRCADGEEAVQTIINGTYDLILLDVMRPAWTALPFWSTSAGKAAKRR